MLSFRDFIIEQTFGEFQQWLQQNNLDIQTLLKVLQQKNPDEQGGNAIFYKVPGTNFGIRIIKGGWAEKETESPQLSTANNPFGDENFGQAIGHYGSNIQILKLQSGIPAGHPYKSSETQEEAKQKYLANLYAAAQMPVEEYIRLFKSIIKLNAQGYVVDPSKSGNMLIDKENGRFNLVDINKNTGDYKNNGGDIIIMLIDNSSFGRYFSNNYEVKKLAKQIIEKAEKASEITGLPINKSSSSVQYSYKHGYGPLEEPYKPTHKPSTGGWDKLDAS